MEESRVGKRSRFADDGGKTKEIRTANYSLDAATRRRELFVDEGQGRARLSEAAATAAERFLHKQEVEIKAGVY